MVHLGMKQVLAASLAAVCSADYSYLDSFLPPVTDVYAANADIVNVTIVSDPSQCASSCLQSSDCISFNYCQQGSDYRCGLSGWSKAYVLTNATSCSWYRRIMPRNDTSIAQAVPWQLQVPTADVMLTGGPLQDAFNTNVFQYLHVRDPLDMLHFFVGRAGAPAIGQCFGWGGWIKGSETGNYLMGAGNALQWATNDTFLRTNVNAVLAGIANYSQPNGWAWAFPESEINNDNLPDYDADWLIRGLLDAHRAGMPGALAIARDTLSCFSNHSLLPTFLPPNGGPDPVQPYPSGFNNVTAGGYGQATGHMIYIQYQGMPGHSLMALSEAGTQSDVDILQELYREDWWLRALIDRDPFHGIWHRQFFSHNYEITAYEAYLDLYVLTGNATYLNAMLGAWDMLRQAWISPGGIIHLNENDYYPPYSYYIGFTGRNIASRGPSAGSSTGMGMVAGHAGDHHDDHGHAHGHDNHDGHAHHSLADRHLRHGTTGSGHGHTHHDVNNQALTVTSSIGSGNGSDPYFHAKCMTAPLDAASPTTTPYASPLQRLRAAAMSPDPLPANAIAGPNDSDPPTGELCGSVFWTKFNQRFHRLFPDNETFVAEMERSIINVGLAALGRIGSGGEGPGGFGIRYFANLHKQKQYPSMHASCCEGQGTRLFGSLPEYVYTLAGPMSRNPTASVSTGIYVDLFAASSINFTVAGGARASLTQETQFPYASDVNLTLTLPAAISFDLALRVPAWLASPALAVTVNGAVWPQSGAPASYLHINTAWSAGANTISFTLPVAPVAYNYTGSSQLPPYTRWTYMYGPVLLVAQGAWNTTVDALVMPQGINPAAPQEWLVPAGDGDGLHFNVTGAPGIAFKPYYEVQAADEMFSAYPCFS